MPVIRPSPKRRKRGLIAAMIVGVLVVALCVGVLLVLGNITGKPPSSRASAAARTASTSLATRSSGQQTGTTTPSGKPAHASPTAPASNLARPSTTSGRPHLGGPFSDFVGKYGSPTSQGDGNSQEFWVGPEQTIEISVVRNDQGEVTQLTILGPNTWNAQQTQSYCIQFLPDGATQFQTANNLIEYHSSAGEIVLNLQTTSCTLSFART